MGTDETISATYLQSAVRGGVASPILLNAQGGNIGIGVTSPAAKLHAVTNVSTIPLIIASGSTTVDLVRITQVGTGNAFVVEDSANPDATMFVINSIGNVGIGANPAAGRLYVQDSTNPAIYGYSTAATGIQGVSTGANPGVKGQGEIGVYGIAQSDTGTMIGVQGTAGDNDVGTGTYIGGYFSVGSVAGTNYSVRLVDGTEGVDKLLTSVTIDGHANWKSDIKVTSIIASASTTTDLVRITQVGTGNALVVEDSTNPDLTPFIVTAAGNVGVGTASPSTGLHVFSTTSGAFRLVDGTQQNGYVLTSDANGVATWQASSGGGGSTVTNPGDNRIITSTGTTTGLNGESNLTFDGAIVGLTGSIKITGTFSGNTTNFVQSELITQTTLLYMSNNT